MKRPVGGQVCLCCFGLQTHPLQQIVGFGLCHAIAVPVAGLKAEENTEHDNQKIEAHGGPGLVFDVLAEAAEDHLVNPYPIACRRSQRSIGGTSFIMPETISTNSGLK